MTLLSQSGLNVQVSLVGSLAAAVGIGNANQAMNVQSLLQLLGGTGAGQIDTVYETTQTIAASGSLTLGLTGGGLVDAFGSAIALLHVKAILLIASAANVNDVQIGPGGANPFNGPFSGTTPAVAVSPGETLLLTKGSGSAVGWVVTPTTGMNLKLANSGAGTGVTFSLVILGTST